MPDARSHVDRQYRELVDAMPDGVLVCDSRGIIRLANPAAGRMFGYEPSALAGQPLDVLLPLRFRAAHSAYVASYAVHRAPRQMGGREFWALHRDGREFPVEISLAPLRLLGEEMTLAAVRDTTDRHSIRMALAESEHRYQAVVQAVDEIVYAVELDDDALAGRVTFVSDSVERITGFAPDAFSRTPNLWRSLICPDDLPGVARSTQEMIESGAPVTRRYRLWHPCRQRYRWMEDRVVPRRDPATGRLTMFGVARDRTEAVEAAEALAAKTEDFETLAQALATFLAGGSAGEAARVLVGGALAQTGSEYGFMGVLVEGPAVRVLAHDGLHWSATENRELYDAALRAYQEQGYLEFRRLDNLFGRVVTTKAAVLSNDPAADPRSGGLPPGHPPLHAFLGVPMISNGQVVGMLAVANRPGGYTSAQETRLSRLAQAAGVLADGYLRRERERALEQQLHHSQRMDAIGRLAGGVAHDFNNLLTVIIGVADLWLAESDQAAAGRPYLEDIRRAADQAVTLTRQLLAFSRRQPVRPTVLDVNETVSSTERLLRRLMRADVRLCTDLARSPAPVVMDAGQLEQVLVNLVINACDAMPSGGSVTITTAVVDVDALGDGRYAFTPGRYVRLTVHDTGTGIPPDALPHVFEPFFTTKPTGAGTGLGLSTVYGIVKQAAGYIDVTSRPGDTAFTIHIPWAAGAPAAVSSEAVAAGPVELAGRTILVADDDPEVCVLMQRSLHREGCRVLAASNGAQALDLIEAHAGMVDLIVADVIMPVMDGARLSQEIRQRWPGLRMLAVSGYPAPLLAEGGQLSPEVPFLQKPFDAAGLRSAVAGALA